MTWKRPFCLFWILFDTFKHQKDVYVSSGLLGYFKWPFLGLYLCCCRCPWWCLPREPRLSVWEIMMTAHNHRPPLSLSTPLSIPSPPSPPPPHNSLFVSRCRGDGFQDRVAGALPGYFFFYKKLRWLQIRTLLKTWIRSEKRRGKVRKGEPDWRRE